MPETDEILEAEIEKWQARLKAALSSAAAVDSEGKELLTNAKAYAADAEHFNKKNDKVRAFESLIWAWAHLEIGQKLGMIKN